MSIKYPYYNAYVLISQNPQDLESIFHEKIIFNTLTDEHLTKIFILQKIKRKASNPTNMTIYLHNLDLDTFKINPKLITMLKNNQLDVNIKNINTITEKDIIDIATYSKFIETYSNK